MLTFEDCLALSDAESVTEAGRADTIGAFRVMARSSSHANHRPHGGDEEDDNGEAGR